MKKLEYYILITKRISFPFLLIVFLLFVYSCRKKNVQDEIKSITNEIRKHNNDTSLYKKRIDLAVMLNLDSLLQHDITQYYRLDGKDISYHYSLALIYWQQKNYSSAIQNISVGINNGHNYYILRCMMYMESGKYQEALIDIDSSLSINSTGSDYILKARLHTMFGDFDKAIATLEHGLKISTEIDTLKVYSELTDYYILKRDYYSAEKYALKLAFNSSTEFIKGLIKYNIGDKKEALKIFLSAHKVDTTAYTSEYYICKILTEQGNQNLTIEYLISAITNGFGFFDLITTDKSFNSIHMKKFFTDLTGALNNSKYDRSRTIKNILRQNKISNYEEWKLVKSRMQLIIDKPEHVEEFIILFRLYYGY